MEQLIEFIKIIDNWVNLDNEYKALPLLNSFSKLLIAPLLYEKKGVIAFGVGGPIND
jgi:hypothetical protein